MRDVTRFIMATIGRGGELTSKSLPIPAEEAPLGVGEAIVHKPATVVQGAQPFAPLLGRR